MHHQLFIWQQLGETETSVWVSIPQFFLRIRKSRGQQVDRL
ncbi:hypothetical protein SPLC1_S081570 [Arthrospira platensis C1]|nr:hypothetical protein SPLC1_S081570 [Arthrospira platensis C1]